MQRGPKIEVASSSVDYVRNMEDDEVLGARCRPGSEEYARDASVKRNIGVIHDAMRTRSKMAIAVGSLAAVLFLAVVVTAILTTVLVRKDDKEMMTEMMEDIKAKNQAFVNENIDKVKKRVLQVLRDERRKSLSSYVKASQLDTKLKEASDKLDKKIEEVAEKGQI